VGIYRELAYERYDNLDEERRIDLGRFVLDKMAKRIRREDEHRCQIVECLTWLLRQDVAQSLGDSVDEGLVEGQRHGALREQVRGPKSKCARHECVTNLVMRDVR
jgi:hypothetical protein